MSGQEGRRLPDNADIRDAQACDYFRVTWTGHENEWWFRDPRGDPGRITKHTVIEHGDGTISVTPSIAPVPGEDGWHGYLTNGVWIGA